VTVAIATMREMPPDLPDDRRLVAALAGRGVEAPIVPWDREEVDWGSFAAVVIRSTWDYSRRRDRFLAWVEAIGDRLHNPPALVAWNSDKHYLADLRDAGLPVVDTRFVGPGDAVPRFDREMVVKPTISAGGRDTGRFAPAAAEAALALVERIVDGGRVAMVQPFLDSVDSTGETAVVLIDGEVSHVLRKRAVLRPDEVAPIRDDALGAAEAMYDPELVLPGSAEPDELELAAAVVDAVRRRFGSTPLYARVDMLRAGAGAPVLLELEAVEPALYLNQADGATDRLAEAIVARITPGR